MGLFGDNMVSIRVPMHDQDACRILDMFKILSATYKSIIVEHESHIRQISDEIETLLLSSFFFLAMHVADVKYSMVPL